MQAQDKSMKVIWLSGNGWGISMKFTDTQKWSEDGKDMKMLVALAVEKPPPPKNWMIALTQRMGRNSWTSKNWTLERNKNYYAAATGG